VRSHTDAIHSLLPALFYLYSQYRNIKRSTNKKRKGVDYVKGSFHQIYCTLLHECITALHHLSQSVTTTMSWPFFTAMIPSSRSSFDLRGGSHVPSRQASKQPPSRAILLLRKRFPAMLRPLPLQRSQASAVRQGTHCLRCFIFP
jgi:hypothetical protein